MARREQRNESRAASEDALPASSLHFMHSFRPRALGELLIQHRVIDESQLETALVFQKARPGAKLGAVLQDLGYVSPRDFMAALSNRLPVVKPFGGS